ncbi:MAG: pantoate--beta-alanine ligase [Gallionella sp.]|nr:pantoate--beta-alanine ligase [Gallionella sp.]
MQILTSTAELRARLRTEPNIVFVPTMGNLHQGHLDLMHLARAHGSCVVASIFVNPLQFGPNEDFDRYPRTFAADCEKLTGLVDVLFAPSVTELYPIQQTVFVEPPSVANQLCGANRPGHFRGMATVVLKLFNLVQPHIAVFGQKDYQQLHIIRQMVTQFNLPIQIIGGATVRAEDGLALSSRNQYLNNEQRAEAASLFRTLNHLRDALLQGESDINALEQAAIDGLTARGWQVDYLTVRNQSDLLPATQHECVILAAAKLGNTRLLDNVEVNLPKA